MALQNDDSRDPPQCPETGPGSSAAQKNGSFRILHGPPGGAIDFAWRSCLADSDSGACRVQPLPAFWISIMCSTEPMA
jgi:hypothetical protein